MVMGGVFQGAHHGNLGKGKAPRTGTVIKRMRQVEAAAIKLLDALDYPGDPQIAKNADELLNEPPELQRPSAGAYIWRQMLGAARDGDPETKAIAWGIADPERFLQDLWLWGYTARQIGNRWKDQGGQPASTDQFVIGIVRQELEAAGIGFHYKSEPEMSGPAWDFIHLVQRLRPTVLRGSPETLDRYIRHSKARRPPRRSARKE